MCSVGYNNPNEAQYFASQSQAEFKRACNQARTVTTEFIQYLVTENKLPFVSVGDGEITGDMLRRSFLERSILVVPATECDWPDPDNPRCRILATFALFKKLKFDGTVYMRLVFVDAPDYSLWSPRAHGTYIVNCTLIH